MLTTIGAKRRWIVGIVTEVVNIVNENYVRDGNIIISVLFSLGVRGAATWSIFDHVIRTPSLRTRLAQENAF